MPSCGRVNTCRYNRGYHVYLFNTEVPNFIIGPDIYTTGMAAEPILSDLPTDYNICPNDQCILLFWLNELHPLTLHYILEFLMMLLPNR